MSTKETVYLVSGMKCNGCLAAVKDVLLHLPGVVDARVDLGAGEARVVGDVAPQSVIQALKEIGYPTSARDLVR